MCRAADNSASELTDHVSNVIVASLVLLDGRERHYLGIARRHSDDELEEKGDGRESAGAGAGVRKSRGKVPMGGSMRPTLANVSFRDYEINFQAR